MDYTTLCAAMGRTVPQSYVGPFNLTLIQANCTTINRVAMFCAQVGEESGGLQWLQELASGEMYEGRKDLGNIHPGDGVRFKGRGILQVTGRTHYGDFGTWCHRQGLLDAPDFFLTNPTALAALPWAFLSAAWYWTAERPQLNSYADARDVISATRAVNGGLNGIDDRTRRWRRALTFGSLLLPTPPEDTDMTPAQAQQLADLAARITKFDTLEHDLRADLADKHAELDVIRDAVAAVTAKVDALTALVKAPTTGRSTR